ncbi:MAG: histidine phosphatase family protein [Candidatus Omnitrophica bacterium]|nr:histidine phosphatase family protein [Candidatus Omnitrophota bacterium]
MAKLILVRHGQTNWSKEKRIQGALDIPLNEEGKKEAQELSEELAKFKIGALYSSPAACSLSTADEIAAPHKLKVKKAREFSELGHGVWQGLLLKDVKKRYKKQYNNWKTSPTSLSPPQGESVKDACDRAISAVHKITDKRKDENICIVSHDIILSIIKCYCKNMDLEKIWDFTPEKAWWEALDF